jgi:hypothetical protein
MEWNGMIYNEEINITWQWQWHPPHKMTATSRLGLEHLHRMDGANSTGLYLRAPDKYSQIRDDNKNSPCHTVGYEANISSYSYYCIMYR